MEVKRTVGSIFVFLEKLSSGIILLLVALTVVNVVMRRLLNMPIFGITEIVEYGTLAVICLAASGATFRREHPSVSLLVETLPSRARVVLRIITDGGCMLLLCSVGVGLLPNVLSGSSLQRTTESLGIPYAIVYGLVVLCIFSVAATYVFLTYFGIQRLREAEVERAIGAASEGAAVASAQKNREEGER